MFIMIFKRHSFKHLLSLPNDEKFSYTQLFFYEFMKSLKETKNFYISRIGNKSGYIYILF